MIRAVVDLNIIISSQIVPRGFAFHVWQAWLADRFTLIISEGMIVELIGKLAEPRFTQRYGVTAEDVRRLSSVLRGHGVLAVAVPRGAVTSVTGDPEDDLVLATARLGNAEYLVTRDNGLLRLRQHDETMIVAPNDFLRFLPR